MFRLASQGFRLSRNARTHQRFVIAAYQQYPTLSFGTVSGASNFSVETTMTDSKWRRLDVHPNELRLEFTLINGQCFAWKPFPLDSHDLAKKTNGKVAPDSPSKGIGKKTAAAADLVARAAAQGGGIGFRGVFRDWVLELRQRPNESAEFRCLNRYAKTTNCSVRECWSQVLDYHAIVYRPQDTWSPLLHAELWKYFQLDTPLSDLYKRWCKAGGVHGSRMKVALAYGLTYAESTLIGSRFACFVQCR